MPKNTFDYTEMRAHVDELITRLGDLATTASDREDYLELCYNLTLVRGLTDYYYTPQADGTFPQMREQDRLQLIGAYYKLANAAGPILESKDTGEVGMAMKDIATQLMGPVTQDLKGLEAVDLSKQNMTLPELISKGRTLAVDLGQQKVSMVGEMSSSRMYLSLDDGDGVQNGYFTPETTVDPEKKYQDMITDLKTKYPAMETLLNHMSQASMQDIHQIDIFAVNYLSGIVRNPRENWKEKLDQTLHEGLYMYFDLSEQGMEKLTAQPDFYKFSMELMDRLKPIQQEYDHYCTRNYVDVPRGSNIERRNLGMYRMAGLLGKQHIMPETKLITVMRDGQPTTGVFMAEAKGVDVLSVKPGDPITKVKPENMENPAILSDISGMQVLDFICGNVDRHPGNFFIRFDPPEGENMKPVGITLIDNDMSFGTHDGITGMKRGTASFKPDQMGVVGQETYNAMRLMTREQMDLMLADCQLSKEELDAAWLRKETLQKAIEADMEYFRDKEPGYTEAGKIRLVPETDWNKYSLSAIAEVHKNSQFNIVHNYDKVLDQTSRSRQNDRDLEVLGNQMKEDLGIPVPEKPAHREPTRARVIGNGLQQEPNPLGLGEDTLNLAIPALSDVRTVGNNLSKRYVLTYMENGHEKTVFYTPPQITSAHTGINNMFEETCDAYPQYRDELMTIRDYYRSDDVFGSMIPKLDRVDGTKLGFTQERFDQLKADPNFQNAYKMVYDNICRDGQRLAMMMGFGQVLGEGRRMELRNVAMSDVSDLIGTGDLICNSRTVRVMCDGKVTEGCVMDLAKGWDPADRSPKNPINKITTDQAMEAYNQPDPLRQMADMQILDYICLNVDRHQGNMFYQYEGIGTDHPRLVGIQGIDNDGSFGNVVPKSSSRTNNLPALDKMKVISREVWEKVQDPTLPDKVAESVLKRGMTQEEADAAKQRIESIKEAVNAGKLRIVERDQWAKGDNTFEKLSAENENNIYKMIRKQIVEPGAKTADERKAKGEVFADEPQKPLKGTMAVKVDQISENVLNNDELQKLQTEAELEWQQEIKTRVESAEVIQVDSYPDQLKALRDSARAMKDSIDAANPFFSFTSKTYKNMSRACNELLAQTEKCIRNMEKNGEAYNEKDAALLQQKLNNLQDASAAYTDKKNKEIERGVRIKDIGRKRMDVSAQVSQNTRNLSAQIKDLSIKERTKISPFEEAQMRLKEEQGKLASLKGNALKEKIADILYLKSLTKVETGARNSEKFKQSLLPRHISSQRQKIMASREFQEMCKQPEDQLRSMAARKGAGDLMSTFMKNMAQVKQNTLQAAKAQQKQNDAPQNAQPAGPAPV